MSALRFSVRLSATMSCFLVLGIALRYAAPAETVTVVADGDGVVTAIYRRADLDDLDVALGGAGGN